MRAGQGGPASGQHRDRHDGREYEEPGGDGEAQGVALVEEAGSEAGPVRSAATVARVARPTQPPSWRELLKSPEAMPASREATPVVAAAATGARTSPTPTPVMTQGPSTSVRKPPPGLMKDSQARPTAASRAPGTRAARGCAP